MGTRVLESARSPAFERIVRLAANGLRAPIACFGVWEEEREVVCSVVGLEQPSRGRLEFAKESSLARAAIAAHRPLVLSDLGEHPLVQELAKEREVVGLTCAVAPVFVSGSGVGALWVVSPEPRAWSPLDLDMLVDLADCIQAEVARAATGEAVSRSSRAPGVAPEPLRRDSADNVSLYATLVTSIPRGAIAIFDQELRCIALDGAMARANPDRAALIGKHMIELARLSPGDPRCSPIEDLFRSALEGREGTIDFQTTDGLRTLELHTAPVLGPRGAIVGGSVLALDKTAEREVAALLSKSELAHRAVVQNLPKGAVFMVDRDLKILTAGGRFVDEILSRSGASTLAGTSARELPDDLRDDMILVLLRTLAGERRRDDLCNHGRWFEVTSVPIEQGGTVTHAVLFLYDVTARREEADELRRTQDLLARERVLLAETLEHIQDGVALRDAAGSIVFANRSFAEMFQQRPEDTSGMSRERYLAVVAALAADPEAFLASLRAAGPGQVPMMDVVLARPRRRVLRRTETEVYLPGSGRSTLVTWRDVTSEHDTLQRLRQVLERAPVGVALVSRGEPGAREPKVHLNLRGKQIIGPEASRASTLWLDGTEVAREDSPPARTLRGEEVELTEMYVGRVDGTRTALQVRGAPLFSDEGASIGGVVVFEDVTSQKDMERLRAEWNALIAHDLQNPLNHIGIHAQLLARQAASPASAPASSPMPPSSRQTLSSVLADQPSLGTLRSSSPPPSTDGTDSAREILAAVTRMSRMVRDLLDLSRLEARNLALERARGRLDDAVRQAVERAAMAALDARLDLSIDGDVPDVVFDADRVAQILDNLLSNALKYGKRDEPIEVRVRGRPGGVEIALTNGGPGLSQDALRQLFQRFRRATSGSGNPARREVQGVGLGLYIARELVEAHGGTIHAESNGGRTTFRFVLPAVV